MPQDGAQRSRLMHQMESAGIRTCRLGPQGLFPAPEPRSLATRPAPYPRGLLPPWGAGGVWTVMAPWVGECM